MSSTNPLRVVVAGVGAFGRNHLRIYRELEISEAASGAPVQLAAIIEQDSTRAVSLRQEFQVPVFPSAEACVEQVRSGTLSLDAASVCVPTVHHARTASVLLSAGVDILVEKPFVSTVEEADALISLAEANRRVLQIGHLERFNPAVTAVAAHLNQPMFFEAHRLSVFTPRSLDVDVILDLMIHDLDVVLSFVDSPVREVRAVGLPVLSGKVDIANVRVEFQSGCVANFTASRVSTERVRKLRFFQPHQYISIDYARQDALLIDVSGAASTHPSTGLGVGRIPVTAGEPLRLEIESFLACVRTRATPRVTAQQGRAALALALEINCAIADHSRRAGLERFMQF
ncbi:MAG: Gfo/Idh/MocA family protein [Acidobacteriaceae bacterium]